MESVEHRMREAADHPSAEAPPSDANMDAKILLGPAAVVEVATPGGFLRQERERQERTLQQVADELHLSRHAIEAIEGNRFAEFGAPVFAKGHLRRYALLLRMSVEEVLARYEQLGDAARAKEILPAAARPHEAGRRVELTRDANGLRIAPRTARTPRWVSAMSIVAVIAVVAGALWRWSGWPALLVQSAVDDTPSIEAASSVDATATQVEVQSSTQAQSPSQSQTQIPTQAQPQPATATQTTAPVEARVPAATSPLAGKVRLKLTFKQDSWAEVYDGRGNRMMYDVGRADLPRVIDADPPVQVVLGYAPAVDVEINGAAKTVPERRINNSVARFAVHADGGIR